MLLSALITTIIKAVSYILLPPAITTLYVPISTIKKED